MKDIEDLLSRYWALAYHEGKTGESRGDEANEVLFELRAAVEADRAQRVPDDAISGALFDFAGFLTTLDVPVRFGSTEEASPMVELLQGFAKKRGLSLDNADVLHWSTKLASTPAQPAQQEPSIPAEFDVRTILLSISPGEDGMGHEVYAASVADVESQLTSMGQELEEWQLGIRRLPPAAHQEPPQPVERKPIGYVPISAVEEVALDGYLPVYKDHGIRE